MLAVVGCGGSPSIAVDTSAPRVVYYESNNAATERQELEFDLGSGGKLGYIRHHQPGKKANTALVYLHGIESHGGWFDGPADLLCGQGYDVYCLDRRGSGVNRENRGFGSGHADSYETLLADIHAFIKPLRSRYRALYLVGLSWGGKLAMSHAVTHPLDCDGLILITPGIRAKVNVGFGTLIEIILADPHRPIKLPIEPEMFTATPHILDKIRNDPLRLRYATAGFLLQSSKLDGYLDRRIVENKLPILLILAGNDRIVDNRGVIDVLGRGKQRILDIVTYTDQTHSVQFDAPHRLVRQMVGWLAENDSGSKNGTNKASTGKE